VERQDVLEFVKRVPVSHLATLEDGQPRVRAMQTAVIDDAGLTFCTGSHKDVCRQLLADPAVELAYWDPGAGCHIRIRGDMEVLEDLDLKQHIVDYVFPFLKPVVEAHGHEAIALFRLSCGQTVVWNQATGHQSPQAFPF